MSKEGIKEGVTGAAMQQAAAQARAAMEAMAALIKPGMSEAEAVRLGNQTLAKMGAQKFWHRTIVRFGEHTQLAYDDHPEIVRILGEHDIFFIDIGPVWDGLEGDTGDTYVVGTDAEMLRAQRDVRALYQTVKAAWRERQLSGPDLYAFAEAEAERLGWQLHPSYVRGHRVAEFPHSVYKGGKLSELSTTPLPDLWILEIQIKHPTRPFGAFYEELL